MQAARFVLAQTERLSSGLQSAFSSLDLQSRVSPSDFSNISASLPASASGGAVGQNIDALRVEILLDASRALQEVFSSIDGLREVAGRFFGGGGWRAAASETEMARLRAAEVLAQNARQVGGEVTDALQNILRELSRMQAELLRSDVQLGAARSPADIVRAHALTAAGGLENLQLLAAQTRGLDDVRQQVFALPVKMGQEWTEVQVKFIKGRKKGSDGKDGGEKHVSVYLNVAPSALGEVAAHFDFHPPASLKLSCQFEKPEAARWFKDQAGAIRDTLSLAGLPGAALEFNVKRKAQPAQASESGENQPVTPVGARSDSVVDFKA
jgi:hypothetical protein